MMSTDKPLTLAELLARLDHPGRYVHEAFSDEEAGTNTDGQFWICESQTPDLSHILETVTLDEDALSALRTAEKLGLEWLATGERFDPAVPLWIAPVEGFCRPQQWVEYARRAFSAYTEADEKWLAKYRVP
jgi:hypothetical protein